MKRAMRCRSLVLAFGISAMTATAEAAQFCSVTRLEGTAAQVERGGAWIDLAPGPLPQTDGRIRTGPETRLQVTCDDGAVVTVGPDSRVDLSDLLATVTESPSLVVQLLEGIAGFVSPDSADASFRVQTPVAVAAVRSTEWLVEHAADTGSSVFVRRGSVEVSNGAESFVLEPGEGITVGMGTVIRPVARWGRERIEQSTGTLGLGWD